MIHYPRMSKIISIYFIKKLIFKKKKIKNNKYLIKKIPSILKRKNLMIFHKKDNHY